MERRLTDLSDQKFELLIIGGGIYGACIARDAAQRGLSVALIDRGDFGHATSANSLKTVHGGLRYLQDLNINRVRVMASERTTWLRTAPHLVHLLPCLMPTSQKFTRNKAVMAAALKTNDWISFDRNRLEDPGKRIPNGRILSKSETLKKLPGFDGRGITGGALWYDAQIANTERLVLSIILSAYNDGAVVANYVEATGLLWEEPNVLGAKVKDQLTGQEFEIRADLVINSTGAWTDELLRSVGNGIRLPVYHASTAFNIVIPQVLAGTAVGFQGSVALAGNDGRLERKSHLFFIAPWSRYSIVGTIHTPVTGPLVSDLKYEPVVQNLIEEVNWVFPGLSLRREDVCHIHKGYLPVEKNNGDASSLKLVRESRVLDHQKIDGRSGLITILGVKFTTARKTAQQATDLALRKLGKHPIPCQTERSPVWGGEIAEFSAFLNTAITTDLPFLDRATLENLVRSYGSEYTRILDYVRKVPTAGEKVSPLDPVIKAQIIHAVRDEMAVKLIDIIYRRTELGSAGLPDQACIHLCAQLMAKELGWDDTQTTQEIAGLSENE